MDKAQALHKTGPAVFMAMVTCYLLARAFAEAGAGAGAALEVVVYSATAALGLEFLISSWRGLWRRADGPSAP
ncbi:MAG TPA: hypothetical protein VEQ61_04565 [Thermoleophilaceae bacterium]|nr:hypothetical protein [Thermoleophilaceae bacterium]